ncbi:MAG: PRC-barrel domain-containing protein [Pseudorhizobium sp.]
MRSIIPLLSAVLATSSVANPAFGQGLVAPAVTEEEDPVKVIPEWSYQPLYDRGVSVENLFDEANVIDRTGRDIGKVENIIFADSGEALAIIAEIGGFADIRETHVSIPWSEISFSDEWDDVNVPINEDNLAGYTMFDESGILTRADTMVVGEIEGGPEVDVGSRVFRAYDLLGDHAYFEDMGRWGYVNDLVVRDGRIAAIVVQVADQGQSRHYAYPFDDAAQGDFDPGNRRYTPPLNENALAEIEEFDYDRLVRRRSEEMPVE